MTSTIECANCGVGMEPDDVYIPADYQEPHCGDCIETCDYCGEWFTDIYDHREYCCESCGRSICPESMYYYCDSCDEYRCERCGECGYCDRAGGLRGYHDNPELIFYGEHDYFMGIELEYNGDASSILSAVHEYDDSEQFIWACEDGSLYGGAEIISHPMTLDFMRNEFDFGGMMQAIKATGNAQVTSGTGLHVHIDRRAFRRNGRHNQIHAYRWLKFVLANQTGGEIIGRRTSEEWAQFVKPGEYGHKGYSETLRVKSDGYRTSDNRYTAVNTTKGATFELRFFKSTYNRRNLHAAIEYAHASVEYARTGMDAYPAVDRFRWETFTDWLAGRPAAYPSLCAVLHVATGDQGDGDQGDR